MSQKRDKTILFPAVGDVFGVSLFLTGQRELAETTGSLWIASRAGSNLEHRLRHRDLAFESSRWERLLILSAEARATSDDAPLIF